MASLVALTLMAASPPPPVTPVVTPPNLSACDFTLPTTFAHVWHIDPVNGKHTKRHDRGAHLARSDGDAASGGHQQSLELGQRALRTRSPSSNSLGYPLPLIPGAIIKGGDEVLLQNGT